MTDKEEIQEAEEAQVAETAETAETAEATETAATDGEAPPDGESPVGADPSAEPTGSGKRQEEPEETTADEAPGGQEAEDEIAEAPADEEPTGGGEEAVEEAPAAEGAEEAVEEAPAAEGAEEAPAAEDQEPAEAASATGRKKRWYVIHTYSGHENKVKANMERAIQYAKMQDRFGEILVATEDYAVMKAGKKQITKRKTFPSYVLVEMDMNDEARALVQNVPGVTHFVGDRRPTPLTEAEVRRIRGEEVREVGKITTEVPFKVGESVKVTQGPFADFVGTVDEINLERGKLRVMVSIFGRPTAVELDLTHVTSI